MPLFDVQFVNPRGEWWEMIEAPDLETGEELARWRALHASHCELLKIQPVPPDQLRRPMGMEIQLDLF